MDFEVMKEGAELELSNYNAYANSSYIPHKMKAAQMKAALDQLTDMERDILAQFFIDRERRNDSHKRRLMAKYKLKLTRLYNMKNDALVKYAVFMTINAMQKCGKYEECCGMPDNG